MFWLHVSLCVLHACLVPFGSHWINRWLLASMGVLGIEQVLLTTETSVQPFGLLFHTGSVFVALASLEIKM